MKLREVLDVGATLLVVGAAVVMIGMRLTEERVSGPENIRDWEAVNSDALRIGPADGPVAITGFLDVECPYCAGAWANVAEILDEFPAAVSFALHHFPLDELHPHATQGAIALECSFKQGRLRQFLDATFHGQESLGTKPWVAFAEEAGIADLVSFGKCMDLPVDSFPRIGVGLSYVDRFRVSATPTLFVNGEHVSRSDLDETVREILAKGG